MASEISCFFSAVSAAVPLGTNGRARARRAFQDGPRGLQDGPRGPRWRMCRRQLDRGLGALGGRTRPCISVRGRPAPAPAAVVAPRQSDA
eukprot:7150283-Pyramimonas_sp.AAC.1